MATDTQTAPAPKWMFWVGWIITLLPTLALVISGVMKLTGPPEGSPDIGWQESSLLGLAIVELGCLAIYLFPPTAILGAILLTGYLGGATATHVRIADPFLPPIIVGVLVWLGLLLRDERLRALLPWRGNSSAPVAERGGCLSALAKTLLIVAAIVFVLGALIAAQPADFHITRSATIDAPASKVFEQVNDFHKWEAWSPWLKDDPDAKVTYEGSAAGTGAIYKWSGNNTVGEGTMTLTESKLNELIRIKLDFKRPIPDTGDGMFTFKSEGEKTVVTWTMSGQKNPVRKAMGLFINIDKMIGDKFDEGLASMKAVAEGKRP